jgi:hypothetical protein
LHSKYTADSDNTAAASTTSYLLSTIFWFKMGRDFCRYMLDFKLGKKKAKIFISFLFKAATMIPLPPCFHPVWLG